MCEKYLSDTVLYHPANAKVIYEQLFSYFIAPESLVSDSYCVR
ncbi:hypothetical protein yinte0001_22340 [Yersinia intermedia ATCC 29909]|nr:hypothetical protein yinte0001_22340 [Yersinia intermedia ATCC 29909]